MDDSGTVTGTHVFQIARRLLARLDFNSTTEFKRQGHYITGLLPQVLSFFPRLDRLFVAATVPDAINLILKLGSELSSSKKEITSVSSLAIIEKVEEIVEKFGEQMEMFMRDAEERDERQVAARCVLMMIKHHEELLLARTVSEKTMGSGDKDVIAATSCVVKYLSSPVVQEFTRYMYVVSRRVPFTHPDGSVTEAASKPESFMMFMAMRHGLLTRFMLGWISFTADSIAVYIAGNALCYTLLRVGTEVRLQNKAWNNTETPQVPPPFGIESILTILFKFDSLITLQFNFN